jgi:hypothetical protein
MTNPQTDENPVDSWRNEIRAFCVGVRQKLNDVREMIDRSESESSASLPIERSEDGEMLEATETNIGQKTAAVHVNECDAPQVVEVTEHGNPQRMKVNPSDDSAVVRLQSVRRQLEEMLTNNRDDKAS